MRRVNFWANWIWCLTHTGWLWCAGQPVALQPLRVGIDCAWWYTRRYRAPMQVVAVTLIVCTGVCWT